MTCHLCALSRLLYFYMWLPWILTYACYLLLNELQFHVLDLDSDQQEINLPNNHILEVVPIRKA